MAQKKTKTSRRPRTGSKGSTKRSAGASGSNGSSAGKKLVIVESPAKARTINRYLGGGYVVRASMGHVRDLPKKDFGVDVDNDFEPTYEPLNGRRKVLDDLKKRAKSAEAVFLATDLDREGEAIAWHLAETLGAPYHKINRVVFNEITKSAIRDAFAQPRGLDMNKVNAQQARRVLDRIVGYEISPLLWRKIAGGLSAGRVQSVAVRLIVEREREIDAFVPEEYWRLAAVFTPDRDAAGELITQWTAFCATTDEKGNPPSRQARQDWLSEHGAFQAELTHWRGERFAADAAETPIEIARALGLSIEKIERGENPDAKGPARHPVRVHGTIGADAPPFMVRQTRQRETRSRPHAPFTTATLQQAAAVRLRFSASRTMRIAQQLYEGVDLAGEGTTGLITYMRSDSRNLSRDAIGQARAVIEELFGEAYLPEKPNVFTSSARAQQAHEAIRPTNVSRHPEEVRSALNDEQFKLYDLIWRQMVACQMPPAVWLVTEAEIAAETDSGEAVFKAMGRRLTFDGFLRVAGRPKGGDQMLPPLSEDQQLAPVDVDPTQHFTQAPPRYTEASLVKALEADGIGRPSTYAQIIQTIQDRNYVEQINRSFHPTDLGTVVTDKLVKHFPQIFDVRFTAHMEDELDKVEQADADWRQIVRDFYEPFAKRLEQARETMVHAKAETEPSDYTCESCGKPMVYRFSKDGRYLACTGYPDCKQTHPVDRQGRKVEQPYVDVACPECGAAMIRRRGRYGPFLSCSRYPECKGIVKLDRKGNVKPPSPPPLQVDLECPKCGSPMNLRRGRRGPWLSCSTYPKCRGRLSWTKLPDTQQADLERELNLHEKAHPAPTVRTLDGTEIGYDHTPREIDPPEDAKDKSKAS
ncbi:MAG: topoisomerase DNA-binding C4 zinc finger domain-containing protein [Phycisphaerae bacterium]|nr:topoisomerase DNA-binding C4 zinc finger domain-containing protein [Phycisphaerae bacterium]